jgi:hypothetical protein
MMTSQGFGLIAELFAAVLLAIALTGFTIQRSKPWLLGAAMAFTILIVAVTILIQSST